MKRRNFLKYLSSIPLIGEPVKLFSKKEKEYAWDDAPHLDGKFKRDLMDLTPDPFEDCAELSSKRVWHTAENMNKDWMRKS